MELVVTAELQQRVEGARRAVDDVDGVRVDVAGHGGVVVQCRPEQVQLPPAQERCEQVLLCQVEADGGDEEEVGPLLPAHLPRVPGQEIAEGAVLDRDPLRRPGRPGREDHVDAVVRAGVHRGGGFGAPGDPLRELVQRDDVRRGRREVAGLAHDHGGGAALLDQQCLAVRGVAQVDRHVRRARLEYREDRHDQVPAVGQRDRDEVPASDAAFVPEEVRELVGVLVELAVGERAAAVHDRHGVGGLGGLSVEVHEQARRQVRVRRRSGQRAGEPVGLGGREDRDPPQRPVEVLSKAPHECDVVAQELGGQPLVAPRAVGQADLPVVLGDGHLQPEGRPGRQPRVRDRLVSAHQAEADGVGRLSVAFHPVAQAVPRVVAVRRALQRLGPRRVDGVP
nr:hypothetical protein [Streptomyces phaeoluteigriseus]